MILHSNGNLKKRMRIDFNKNRITASAMALGVLALLLIGILLGYRKLGGIMDQIYKIKQEIFLARQAQGNLSNMNRELSDYEKRFLAVDQKFIDAKIPRDYIKFLQQKSEECSVPFKIMSTNNGVAAKNINAVLFRLQFSGEFGQAMCFLGHLESNMWIAEVTEMNITGQGGSKNVDINVLVQIYSK